MDIYFSNNLHNKCVIFLRCDDSLMFELFSLAAPIGICQSPHFNDEARSTAECVPCFCFGITEDCASSKLHLSQVQALSFLESILLLSAELSCGLNLLLNYVTVD